MRPGGIHGRSGGLNRREFLSLTGVTALGVAGSVLLPACGSLTSSTSGTAPSPPVSGDPYYFRAPARQVQDAVTADVVVYGATVAGVAAAVQLRRLGLTAVIAEPTPHAGGMTTGGLSATDTGYNRVIGGLAKEMYAEIAVRYGTPYGYQFEPHIASEVIQSLLDRAGVRLYLEEHPSGVDHSADGSRITVLRSDTGRTFHGQCFIDASYDGDLLALAGVSHTTAREANSVYHESLNGIQVASRKGAFTGCVDPSGSAGPLPGVSAEAAGVPGAGSPATQAYCFRLTVVRSRSGIGIDRPAGYDPGAYELSLREMRAGGRDPLSFQVPLPRGKFDLNNGAAVSIDLVGGSTGWAQAGFVERQTIFQRHLDYQRGLMWFLANDQRVPTSVRTSVGNLRLAADEFQATGGWPPQLYVREARRMVSDTVLTEHDVLTPSARADSVGSGSYTIDSHACRRVMTGGCAANEGVLSTNVPAPYAIPYGAIVPRRAECTNLLVPVCLSASHVAWCSLRTEPVLMILGQSAGAAAALAVQGGKAVQDVDVGRLRATLVAAHQVVDPR